MADSDPISDGSVSSKKRKLNNGLSHSKLWDSDNDSGSDLFDEHETVPTQPIGTVPTQPLGTLPFKRDFHSSQRPGDASLATQAFTYRTQQQTIPTQQSKAQDKSTARQTQYDFSFKTQPTQAAYSQHYTQSKDIQVERSSPGFEERTPQKPTPIRSSLKPNKSSLITGNATLAMAPRGTAFRPPVSDPTPVVEIDSDEDDPPIHHSSDEEGRPMTSFIRPTQFKKAGRGVDTLQSQVVEESPRLSNGSTSRFQELVSGFKHDLGYSSIDQRDSEAEAADRRAHGMYLRPHKSVPYKKVSEIPNLRERSQVERIQRILTDKYPVSWCLKAIQYCGESPNESAAMNWLVNQNKKAKEAYVNVDDLAPTPLKQAARGIAQPTQRPPTSTARSSTKQTVNTGKSIAQKYGAAAVRKSTIDLSKDESESDSNIKRKGRRLMRGRRRTEPSSSAEHSPEPSPERDAPPSPTLIDRSSKHAIQVEDEDETADDDDRTEDDQDVPMSLQHRLLKFFNTCAAQEMVDLSGQPLENAEAIVAARPFRSLAQVENVPNPTRPRANPVGIRMVEVCQDMMKGYDATAQLVEACEKLAQPIQAALDDWKLEKQENGQLSIAKVDQERLLAQPHNMSADVKLMAHQIVGLNWLHLLWAMRTSCILADDMGLGKTCQIISFLAQLQLDGVEGPHLVVVPASTLENWIREFARFAPSLTIIPYSGSLQERHEARETLRQAEIDVVITTYHYATNDHEFFRKELAPVVCVYDEAHQLRNPKTKKYSQTMSISKKAEFRVLLTGTPMQNNLQELVAILAFIMPDMFRARKEELELIFKHNAGNMIEGHASLLSAQRISKARSMITPFILRRRKAQVISLPAKVRRVEYCEMSSSQSELYLDLKQTLLAQRTSGKKGSKLGNALMDMRKISIHPLLMRKLYDDETLGSIATILQKIDYFSGSGDHAFIVRFLNGTYHAGLDGNDFSIHKFCSEVPELHEHMLPESALMDSGKIGKLKELLTSYAANGDKVLLFSQFVILLNILEPIMNVLGIKYMRLDGSTDTNERQDMIDHFNSSPETTLFMLSTKAGGAGINLASANKVIVFDTGFNPQDDIQAENRAHRVGQTREVEVVRLVTRDTIEEQLLALGESKLALDERVAGDGETTAAEPTEDAAAEKANAKKVEQMLLEELDKSQPKEDKSQAKENVKPDSTPGPQQQDLKDMFATELRKTGIKVG